MATFELGEEKIEIPVFNLRKLKKAWPLFQKAANVDPDDPMASFDEAIKAICIGLEGTDHAELTPEQIEEKLLGPQVLGLQKTMTDIMKEAGLVSVKKDGSAEGNADAGESPAPSTEISTPSSANSSQQDAKEEVGAQ